MDISEIEVHPHEEFRTDLRSMFLGAIRVTLELLLEEEVRELVGVGRWQKALGRKDYRNGSYLRQLITSMGDLEVTVPRTSGSGSACEVLGRTTVGVRKSKMPLPVPTYREFPPAK